MISGAQVYKNWSESEDMVLRYNPAEKRQSSVAITREHRQIIKLLREACEHQDMSLSRRSIEQQFFELAQSWKSDTLLLSSATDIVTHSAYQRIIGMGEKIVPLILRELQDDPNHWFWALKAITGENPAPPEYAGKIKEIAACWLKWGQERGYTI